MAYRGIWLAVALGAALRGPSCGTDTPTAGPNAPCTRSSDCEEGLACTGGMCATLDAGAPPDASAPADPPDPRDARTSDARHDE